MKKIIVTTDFSVNALNAVKYAFGYAEKTKSTLTLYHSYINPTSELNLPLAGIHLGKQQAKAAAESQMKKLVDTMVKLFLKVRQKWFVEPGLASENIVSFVKKNKANLLIMGTTGAGYISSAIIGSTASAVIRKVGCPILAVPHGAKFKGIKTVMVATDLGKSNLSKTLDSVAFAKQFQAQVLFVHIHDPSIADSKNSLDTMKRIITNEVKYKNISFAVYEDSDILEGIDLLVKKQKPDILSMMTYGLKFPETIWRTRWVNKISYHTKIPLLITHKDSKAKTDQTKRSNQ